MTTQVGQATQSSLDSPSRDSLSFFAAYPLVFYFPETRLGVGGAGIYTYRAEKDITNKASNIQIGVGYTLNKQLLLYSFFNIWRAKNSQLINGEVGYYDYFYPFYGIGKSTSLDMEEDYYVRFPRVKGKYLFLNPFGFYWGPSIHFDRYSIYNTETNGILDNDIVNGSHGGNILGAGLSITLDRRDVQFYPTKGQFLEASVLVYSKVIGSDYNYAKFSISLSQYLAFGSKISLAVNVLQEYVGADAPFQELSLYGGPKYGRGYVIGRFRDRMQTILQSELRFPVFWRFKGAIFTSIGNVSDEFKTLTTDMKFNYGAGLRFLLSKNDQLHIRVDYGRSMEGGSLYLTIGEAF